MLLPVSLYSQENPFFEGDSIKISKGFLTFSDSLALDSAQMEIVTKGMNAVKEPFKPNPTKAVIYSAVFPGLGQIYNRKYWKLPIIYGGFLGCVYAISWNNNQYTGYKDAYREFLDDDPETNAWLAYKYYSYSNNPNEWNSQQVNGFANALKNKKDYFRRYRDLSYIITVGLYAICMIDAYVDAQLFEFDISEDLSLRIDPVLFERTQNNSKSFGLQCSFTF
jgi:hypothetical protein